MIPLYIDIVRAILMAALFAYLEYVCRRGQLRRQPGRRVLRVAFGLVLLAMLFDLSAHFPALAPYIVIGPTTWQRLLTRMTFLLGGGGIVLGMIRWVPGTISLGQAQESLEISREHLERLAAERTQALSQANERLQREVLERKAAEEQANAIFEFAPDAYYLTDLEGRFLSVNRQFGDLSGWPPAEIVGKTYTEIELIPRAGLPGALDTLAKARTGQATPLHEVLIHRRDGTQVPVEVSTRPIDIAGCTYLLGVARDITHRKRAERFLQAYNAATLAMEQALDAHQIFAAVADELSRIGFKCTLMSADEAQSALTIIHTNYGPRALALVEQLSGTKASGFTFHAETCTLARRLLRDRETTFEADTSASIRETLPAVAGPLVAEILRVLRAPRCIMAPLVAENQVIGALSVQGADLTAADIPVVDLFARQMAAAWHKVRLLQDREHRLEELKQTQAQLIQAQKMEAIGRLAGGVAHDFNNLLTVINGYSDFMAASLPPDDPLRSDLEEIRQAGQRAAELTRQLLAFSRRQLMEPVVLDLNAVLEGMAKMLCRLIGEDIHLDLQLAPDLAHVRADPGQLEQVIINLVINSRDAMPTGGSLTLTTGNMTLDNLARQDGAFVRHLDVQPGEYVLLSISDTGCGMTPEVQEHLFEPFFTTKERGKGTGLGLATVYGIVKQSGGAIHVYSEVGRGTTFRIYLPQADQGAERAEPAPEATETPRGHETILIVEDQAEVRSLVARTLQDLGYEVIQAERPEQAVEIYRSMPIALVLSDVVMPGLSGPELADRLRQIDPAARVLYMSGYTEEAITQHGLLADADAPLVTKPFTIERLAQAVREGLS